MADALANDAADEILRLLALHGRVSFGTQQAVAEIVQQAIEDYHDGTMQDAEWC